MPARQGNPQTDALLAALGLNHIITIPWSSTSRPAPSASAAAAAAAAAAAGVALAGPAAAGSLSLTSSAHPQETLPAAIIPISEHNQERQIPVSSAASSVDPAEISLGEVGGLPTVEASTTILGQDPAEINLDEL
jgi:hypothetical protein